MQVEDRKNEYLAYFKSDFLKATFALYFNDNILGSVALASFSEMIRYKYDVKKIEYVITSKKLKFKNPALLDVLSNNGNTLKLAG